MPQLQVRQLFLSRVGTREVRTEFEWVDVQSPNWLIGYMMIGEGWAYEFRHAPEGAE